MRSKLIIWEPANLPVQKVGQASTQLCAVYIYLMTLSVSHTIQRRMVR
jgi:hypothetical protein